MRVLHVTSGNLYGGIETLLVTLARFRHLCPEMEPEFAVCFDGRVARELREQGVAVHHLGPVRARNPISVLAARRRLGALLSERSADVVICHGAWPHAIFGPAARATGFPLVLWRHGPLDRRHWLERWAARTRPDLIVANSHFVAGPVREAFPDIPVEVVYCPVAPPEHQCTPEERAATRAELGVAGDAVVIVQVSRMEALKGHRVHLEALARLRGDRRWVCWQIGGAQRPEERQYLDALIASSHRLGIASRVRFLGHRSDVSRLLQAADVYCQPNTQPDAFGISFVEALYSGLPVVTTPIGGACEIVDDGTGLLVGGDPESVSPALEAMIDDNRLRSTLGANGPRRAADLCDPRQQLAKIYMTAASLVPAETLSSQSA
jgi:glycosyltransferase involved in cell wall biosynthesis